MAEKYSVVTQYLEWRQKTVVVEATDEDDARHVAEQILSEEEGAENIILGEVTKI